MKICIGGSWYATKKYAKACIKSILRPLVGCEVKPDSEHYNLILGLFERSLSYRPKVTHFEVVEKLSGVGVRAVISDDYYVDWSVREAIAGHSVSHYTQLTSALRNAIRPQIREFKAGLDKRCAMCDCSGFLQCDHILRFRDLMKSFIAGRADVPREFWYGHDGYRFIPRDSDFEDRWLEFHKTNCSLRLLCPGCHALHTRSQHGVEEISSSSDA